MDVYCRRCREPWDNDTIHEEVAERQAIGEAATYAEVAAEFRRKGCAAFREFTGRSELCEKRGSNADVAAIQDLLGDDMDGATAMLEDFGLV